MPTILSTKVLSPPQQELILNTGIGLVHFDILGIEQREISEALTGKAILITSKNALPSLEKLEDDRPVFCVGEVTASLIRGRDIKFAAENSAILAQHIIKNYSDLSYDYLCGSHRRDELPNLLRAQNISLKEHVAYRSHKVSKSFDRTFARVLFYSPRGVIAFAKANPQKTTAICIGNTTATEARKHFNNVITATRPSVVNTIVTAIKSLQNDQK